MAIETEDHRNQISYLAPQVRAYVYLHYVFDLWFHRKWRSERAEGDAIIVRYADDVVVGFERKRDAERFLHALGERLGQFDLALHPDKTRLIEFGRFAEVDRRAGGWAARRRSTSWASRITAGRPGTGGSGSDASPLQSG